MKLLTFDMTLNLCSIALKKEKKIDQIYQFSYKNNNQMIICMIQKILFKNSILIKEIDYIAFSKGPGSFTGIRIATSVAKGISTGLKIPLIGISTLKILAEQAKRKTSKKKFIILMYANKKNIYWGQYVFKNKIWILIKKELFISNKIALKKLKEIKKKWNIIQNVNFSFLNNYKKKRIFNISNPFAIDIIPLALQIIKNNKNLKKTIIPNYLNNKINN